MPVDNDKVENFIKKYPNEFNELVDIFKNLKFDDSSNELSQKTEMEAVKNFLQNIQNKYGESINLDDIEKFPDLIKHILLIIKKKLSTENEKKKLSDKEKKNKNKIIEAIINIQKLAGEVNTQLTEDRLRQSLINLSDKELEEKLSTIKDPKQPKTTIQKTTEDSLSELETEAKKVEFEQKRIREEMIQKHNIDNKTKKNIIEQLVTVHSSNTEIKVMTGLISKTQNKDRGMGK